MTAIGIAALEKAITVLAAPDQMLVDTRIAGAEAGVRSGLDTELTPLRFLQRAAAVHPRQTAIVDGPRRLSYAETAAAVGRNAQALRASGLRPGDRVGYLASNSAELLMAHFAVPLAGGVLVAMNTRLSPEEIQYMCGHAGLTFLFAEAALVEALSPVIESLGEVSVVVLPEVDGTQPVVGAATTYAAFLARGNDDQLPWSVADETATITVNYTSGTTTGKPKGVMYSHRGAYLNSLGQLVHQGFGPGTTYLWTLPMFHCNGWCSVWAVTAVAGTHVCVRAVRGPDIWRAIAEEHVTHLAGAPTVLSIMAGAEQAQALSAPLTVVTAGAAPSPTIIARMRSLNAEVVHVYGLTETYGPYSICEPQPDWIGLDPTALATHLARQGVGMVTAEDLRVVVPADGQPDTLVDVPADGASMGEIVMRGNTVMKGYLGDEAATAVSFQGGWFHSGDLGVRHPDGYVQLLDRAKDVVVSGGENISSIEVEQALLRHEAVADVAVIGVPDERWGERPKAFVVLKPGAVADEATLIAHVRMHLATYKAPRAVEFVAGLEKTSTGKTRKDVLKDKEWAGHQSRIQG